jgi:hypothetical protein
LALVKLHWHQAFQIKGQVTSYLWHVALGNSRQ